ncbi:MAG: DUF917 family protein [Chloroflexaceae bacterium]|nr:DUF917 family protein [Chloroflexaceae bacterium]
MTSDWKARLAVMRVASVASGGFIAAARNPVPASYVRDNAALGSVSLAIDLGKTMLAAADGGGAAVVDAVVQQLDGELLGTGTSVRLSLRHAAASTTPAS